MAEFIDFEGHIPVSMDVKLDEVPPSLRRPGAKVSGCMAWDTDPPRPFDPVSARRNAHRWLTPATFWPFVSKVRAERAKASSS